MTKPCLWAEAPTSVDFLADVLDHLAHPVFVKDRAFRWVLLNRALCEMVGFSREAMLGKTDYDFFPRAEADHFRRMDAEVFATGVPNTVEETITDATGQRHVLATTKLPLFGASGEVTHLIGTIHDMTRLKEAEDALRIANEELERRVEERTRALADAQEQLVRKERLAVLGRLAGGLAHQIRNPLGAITNAAYVLDCVTKHEGESDLTRAIAIVHEEAWRANRIITDLLDYARVRPPSVHPIDLPALVDETLSALKIPHGVVVERDLPELPLARVDADQVTGALANLIRNAVEAMPSGGTLTLRARRDGGELVLSVIDTGVGIAPAIRAKLFEPLVTTKASGLGLGLTTARTLVENQRGTIRVQSEVGRGTTVEVRLPVCDPG
jgi:PAS domain S-box-containing protein